MDKPIAKRVRCKNCGAEYSDYPWTPGTLCPDCNSMYFEPVVVIGTSSDYATADRSQGFAPEDLRFGRLAQWAEFISPKQLQQILFRQGRAALQGSKTQELGRIFLKEKILNRQQVNAILAARCVEPGNTDDLEFGIAARQAGVVTDEQLEECRRLQDEASADGKDVPPLPLLVYEKRYMREAHIIALLRRAEREGKGVLWTIRKPAAASGTIPLDRASGNLRIMLSNPLVRAGLTCVVLLILSAMWYGGIFGAPEDRFIVRCTNCKMETGASVTSKWPVKCGQCEQATVYPLAICMKCGIRFTVKNPAGYGVKCPKCGSIDYKLIIGGKVDADKIEQDIRSRQQEVE